MSIYSFDPERHALLVSWQTGRGHLTTTVATLDARVDGTRGCELAHRLSGLSAALWRTYTHPPEAAGDDLAPNTEGWRREGHREAFAVVATALNKPNLPSEDGTIISCYNPVEENAHIVGRALHEIDSTDLTQAVVLDVAAEMDAVINAESGDLSGRARQAVALTRSGASPIQVVEAYRILEADPLGSERLFTDVDPAAAAIAAAHWLGAAADIASTATGTPATQVVVEADNIEALQVETPTYVLEALDADRTPRDVVTELISAAIDVAEGRIPDPESLAAKLTEAFAKAERYNTDVKEFMPRVSILDPTRPALDLLEDLLSGIRGCWLLYREVSMDSSDNDDSEADDEEFVAAVRDEANATRDVLS